MGLFTGKAAANVQLSQRQLLEARVRNSRNNILWVVAFTLINILLLVSNSNSYFLFSAYIPYMLADYGMYFGGIYPAEYYGEFLPEITFLGNGYFATMLVIAAVILVLYVLCWVFAKKKPTAWLIVALVLFSMDTALFLLMQGINLALLVDYLFHGWVIVILAMGLSAIKKLKALPEEEIPAPEAEIAAPVEEPVAPVEE